MFQSLLVRGLVALMVVPATMGQGSSVSFIHMNDHHSHVDEQTFDLRGDNVPLGLSVNVTRLRARYGGAPRSVALMKQLKANATDEGRDAFCLHAGDALTGTLYYTFFGVLPDAAVMNAAGLDVFAVGNHEFDGGDSVLANLIQNLTMPTISSNIRPGPNSSLNDLGDKSIASHIIKDLPNGKKLGICGVTTKLSTERSSFPDEGTTLDDEVASATACVNELKTKNITMIALLSHVGYGVDASMLSMIDGVDVIIGGHSHTLMGGNALTSLGFTPRSAYAELVNGVCIVHSWEYFKVISRVDVDFDEDGNVVQCNGQTYVSINPDTYQIRDENSPFDRKNLNASDAAIVTSVLLQNIAVVNTGEDQDTVDAIRPFRDQVGDREAETIATAETTLCHTRGGFYDAACSDKPERTFVGGGVCLLVAQGFLYNVPTADVAIQNSGGCRTSIEEGEFTFGDAFTVLPFTNTLVILKMTGAQIKQVLEDALSFTLDAGGSTGAFPVSAGLRWKNNSTMPTNERISELEVNIRLEEDSWSPIDMMKNYTVVTNDFIAAPRDGYLTFGEIDKSDPSAYTNTFIEYGQSLVNFAKEVQILRDPPLDVYSTQLLVTATGETVDLSSIGGSDTAVSMAPSNAPSSSPSNVPTKSATGTPTSVPTAAPTSGGVVARNAISLVAATALFATLLLD